MFIAWTVPPQLGQVNRSISTWLLAWRASRLSADSIDSVRSHMPHFSCCPAGSKTMVEPHPGQLYKAIFSFAVVSEGIIP